jgi:hypothetical protein
MWCYNLKMAFPEKFGRKFIWRAAKYDPVNDHFIKNNDEINKGKVILRFI